MKTSKGLMMAVLMSLTADQKKLVATVDDQLKQALAKQRTP